jgi:hypothetical protein
MTSTAIDQWSVQGKVHIVSSSIFDEASVDRDDAPVRLVRWQMRALRYHGRSDMCLDDVPETAVTPGRVKVKIHWCGVCGEPS